MGRMSRGSDAAPIIIIIPPASTAASRRVRPATTALLLSVLAAAATVASAFSADAPAAMRPAAAAAPRACTPAQLPVVPLPANATCGGAAMALAEGVRVRLTTPGGAPRPAEAARAAAAARALEARLARLARASLGRLGRGVALLREVRLEIRPAADVSCGGLAEDVAVEAYTLSIDDASGIARIDAACLFGLGRGIATLEQLMSAAPAPAAFPVLVADRPRFAYRGVLLDSARHFKEPESVRRLLDAMRLAKLNVLHWHVVDAQSFPLEVDAHPRLAGCGAFDAGAVYPRALVRNLTAHAADLGVRVVFEVDAPGHAAAWGRCMNITLDCPEWDANVNNVALDVTSAAALEVAVDVVAQLAEDASVDIIDGAWVHLGGDEISGGCLRTSRQVKDWERRTGGTAEDALVGFESAFLRRAGALSSFSPPIVWDDVLEWYGAARLPADGVVINAWRGESNYRDALRGGYRSIYSFPWYMDKSVSNCTARDPIECSTPDWSWGDSWRRMYLADPVPEPKVERLVLGGQASAWSEYIDDDTMDAYYWPRTAAVAERLWSAADVRDLASAQERLQRFACFLKANGVRSGPLGPSAPCRRGAAAPWR